MRRGEVVSVHFAPEAGTPMETAEASSAVPGKGLEGDRYAEGRGTFSHRPGPDRQVTLMEVENIEALKRDHDIDLKPASFRRNIVTRGVPLGDLVGKHFRVGEVLLR